MRRSFLPAKRRRGFTLIELAIVMGVIGGIVGAIWWASSNTNEAQKEASAVTELQTVSHNIIAMMQGRSFQACPTVINTNNITSCMTSTQAIPAGYVNSADGTLADNPWSPGNFMVYSLPNGFRISFYNVTKQGCIALLMQGTACDAGQSGCPTQVATYNITTSDTATPDATLGWGGNWTIGANTPPATLAATDLCLQNTYSALTTTANNSVNFDYSF